MKRFAVPLMACFLIVLPVAPVTAAGGSTGTTGVAAGDFTGDGRDDLAVGVPYEDVGPEGSEVGNAGAVEVIYSGSNGLRAAGDQLWTQDSPHIAETAEAEDDFGSALAAGDFDGDGFDDLAVGAPGETVGSVSAGAVNVIYGSANGLRPGGDQLWHQDSPEISEVAEEADNFGWALTTGDFGKGRRDDLAIGIPRENVGQDGLVGMGAAEVIYGGKEGLRSGGDQFWHQDRDGVKGVGNTDDHFGWSLAAADLGHSRHDDLAVGVPEENFSGLSNAGAVNVLYGSRRGLRVGGNQRWTQDSPDIAGKAEDDDSFGWAVTAGAFGRGGSADLAVGSPFEDVGPEGSEVPNAGQVNVIYAGPNGLRAPHDQLFTQSTDGIGDSPQDYDNFGNSLTAADFGKTGKEDLAVGVLFEDLPAVGGFSHGLTHVLYGSRKGVRVRGDQIWTQNSPGVQDDAETNDDLSISLAAGDFGRASVSELVMGASGEAVGGQNFAGALNVLYGKSTGLSAVGDQFWHQNRPGIAGVAEENDFFAYGLQD